MSSLTKLLESLESKSEETAEVVDESLTGSEYVEKLASAVEFMLNDTEAATTEKTAAPKDADVSNVSNRLLEALQDKLKNKDTERSSEEDEFIAAVIDRVNAEEPPAEKNEVDVAEEAESAHDEGEEVAKAASAKRTLTQMLRDKHLNRTEDADESATQDSVKTAASREVNVSDLLRNSLLRKVGRTEV